MLKNKCYLVLTIFLALSGCVSKKTAPLQEAFALPPTAPAGMRVSSPYISALNEPCYILVSLENSFVTNGAICIRKGVWEVVPSISDPIQIGSVDALNSDL